MATIFQKWRALWKKQKTELQLIKLSEIQSQEVSWLWFPFIPYGKLTIVQGDPGDGKTTFILNIAAKLSKGESLDSVLFFRLKEHSICRLFFSKRSSV